MTMRRGPVAQLVLWLTLILGSAAFVFPLWWMLVVSLLDKQRAGSPGRA